MKWNESESSKYSPKVKSNPSILDLVWVYIHILLCKVINFFTINFIPIKETDPFSKYYMMHGSGFLYWIREMNLHKSVIWWRFLLTLMQRLPEVLLCQYNQPEQRLAGRKSINSKKAYETWPGKVLTTEVN